MRKVDGRPWLDPLQGHQWPTGHGTEQQGVSQGVLICSDVEHI